MSQENVEIVRRQFALLSQGDYEAFFDEFPLEGVFDFSRRLIDPVILRGRDEMRRIRRLGLCAALNESRYGPHVHGNGDI